MFTPDISFAVGRVARYVDKWCPWAEAELAHLAGYLSITCGLELVMLNAGDSWDDLLLHAWSDADFNVPKSTTGFYLELVGPKGSQYPLSWGAARQDVTTTSTGESESLAWATTAKNAIRLAAMVEYTRPNPVEIVGRLDNQAVEQAIRKGYSQKLGHLKKHAEVSLLFLHECGIVPNHTPGIHNIADAFTKSPRPQ